MRFHGYRYFACMMAMLILASCTARQEEVTEDEDVTGPWIDVKQYEVKTTVGKEVDLTRVFAYDAIDGACDVSIEDKVDYNTPGEYYVTYKASDRSGNESEVIITVIVSEESNEEEEEVYGCETGRDIDLPCDRVLEEDASQYDKLYYSESGKALCEADMKTNEACEIIYTNNNEIWGYGLKKGAH